MQTIITTVGRSLITNAMAAGCQADGESLRVYLETNRPKSCAEMSVLDELGVPKGSHVYFICSDSDDSVLCGQVMADYYTEVHHCVAFVKRIPGLTKDYNQFRDRGLREFVNELADILDGSPRDDTLINATGGFKAQTAYATLMGLLFGVPVYYLHEDFKRCIALPPLPIDFNFAEIDKHHDVIERIRSALTRKEASEIAKQLPEHLRLMVGRSNTSEGYTLTPIGEAIWRAYQYHQRGNRDRSPIPITVYKSHTSLWGDGPITLDQIDEEEIRTIFQRMQNWRAMIREVRLRYMEAGHAAEPHLEYKKKGPGYLRYHANTPRGTQALDIVVDEGQEEYVLKQLGKKIYA